MICENCQKHIERKFLSKGKTVNCLNYACERPYRNPGLIECTRDEICDYIYQILQPERSKREDLNNELDKFKPKSMKYEDGYFPPPWNPYEFPEKTLGWFEFQKAMKENPTYYLGCGALNTMET